MKISEKNFLFAIWLGIFPLAAFGYRLIKEALVFIPMKLYDIIIQHNVAQ